jgi:hypothetical protein
MTDDGIVPVVKSMVADRRLSRAPGLLRCWRQT